MDDLISRAAAIDYLMTNMGWRDEDGYEVDDADEKRAIITDLVNGIPGVDAVPVLHGRWIYKERHRKSYRQYNNDFRLAMSREHIPADDAQKLGIEPKEG